MSEMYRINDANQVEYHNIKKMFDRCSPRIWKERANASKFISALFGSYTLLANVVNG